MKSQEVPHLHAVAKLELTFKLLFFLRDLGIKNAILPADIVWRDYMEIVAHLSVGG